ncbi:MAG: O-antigen ligase family protein [Bradymonadales bacterium]|nr:O-antigen ligase family protein [Bradymonadales bacterium]
MGKSGKGGPPEPFDRVAAVVAGLVLFPPLLLFGGVHPTIQWGLLLFVSLLLLFVVLTDRMRGRSFVWHPVPLLPLLLSVWALLQVIPLPLSWLQVIAPLSARSVLALDGILGQQIRHAPVSLDPGATLASAARWWSVGLASLVLLQTVRSRRVRRIIPWMVLAMAVFTVVSGAIQAAVSTDRIYGLFQPWHSNAQIGPGGPFINANHAGHLYLMASMACLAMMGTPRRRSTYTILFGVFLLCVAGMMHGGARGALLVLVICSLAWAVLPGRGLLERYRLLVPLGLVTLDVLALLALKVEAFQTFFRWESLHPQLELGKFRLVGAGIAALEASPWVGLGADALPSAQVAVIPLSGSAHMGVIENDYLQLLVDFGVVGVFGLLVTAALLFWLHGRRSDLLERSHRQAWWLVIAALALSSLVNFTIQLPALLLPLIALFLSRLARLRRLSIDRRLTAATLGSLLCASALLLAFHPAVGQQPLPTSPDRLRALLLRQPLDGRHLWTTAVQNLDRFASQDVERLAERSAQLAGNDAPLLAALGEYRLSAGSVLSGLELLDRAWSLGFPPATRLEEIAAGTSEVELLVAVCQRFPRRAESILRSLVVNQRYADLMQTVLALPDSPLSWYYRTRAALGLGERQLAQGFAEQINPQPAATPSDCIWTVSTYRLVGNRQAAVDAISSCLQAAPDEPRLIITYARLALETRESAESLREAVDDWLDRLNLLVPADSAHQRPYHELRATTYARDGRCQAAELMLESCRQTTRRFAYVPAWVWDACPDLPRQP